MILECPLICSLVSTLVDICMHASDRAYLYAWNHVIFLSMHRSSNHWQEKDLTAPEVHIRAHCQKVGGSNYGLITVPALYKYTWPHFQPVYSGTVIALYSCRKTCFEEVVPDSTTHSHFSHRPPVRVLYFTMHKSYGREVLRWFILHLYEVNWGGRIPIFVEKHLQLLHIVPHDNGKKISI